MAQNDRLDRDRRTPTPGHDGPERRRKPTPMISKYTFRGRRREVRRVEDAEGGYYVDRNTRFEMIAVLTLLVLTVTDALATLHILSNGGSELNPIMRQALEVGNEYFLVSKLAISFVGGVLILIHTRFPGVKVALHLLLALYGGVVVYHGVLISKLLR